MTVSEQIIQVLNALCEKFGLVIDWTSENVIPYASTLCAKLISYEIWTSVTWMAFVLVPTIVSIVAFKLLCPIYKRGLANQKTYEIGWSLATVATIIGLVAFYFVTICVLVTQVMDIITCVTFPELVIVDYIQSIINNGT